MISARDLTFRYPDANANTIDDFDLDLPKGQFGILTGPGGTGKSTFITLLLAGKRYDGSLEVNGAEVSIVKDVAAHRRSIGLVSEEVGLISDRTVGENVVLPLELAGVHKARTKERLVETLHRFGIEAVRNEQPHGLSDSERRRAMLARAIIHEPLLLVLDEPTLGLDTASAAALWDLLFREHQRGMTILAAVSSIPDDPRFQICPKFPMVRSVARAV